MKKTLLLLCILSSLHSFGQKNNEPSTGQLGIGLHLACPQSELKNIKYDDGFGLNLSYLTRKFPKNADINFQLGARMDFANMKSRIFDSLEIVDASNDKPLPGGANVKVGNRMFGLLAVMRVNYGWEDKKFTPYMDLLAGKRNYSTYSVLSLNEPQSNEDYESQVIDNRVIHTNRFHMGLGAGFTYRLSNNLLLELGATYTVGAKGAALPLPDVYQTQGGNEIYYSKYQTVRTDILLINAGFKILLHKHNRAPSPQTRDSRTKESKDGQKSPNRDNNDNDTPINNPEVKDRDSSSSPNDKKSPKIKPDGPSKKKDNS